MCFKKNPKEEKVSKTESDGVCACV